MQVDVVQFLGQEDPWGGHSNSLQYSCLESPMDRGAWQVTVHGVAQSQTRLSHWWVRGLFQLFGGRGGVSRNWATTWVRKILYRREWLPTPVFSTGKVHGQGSLVSHSACGHKKSDTTEQPTLFDLSWHLWVCHLANELQWAYNEAQVPLEVDSSTILDIISSDQILVYPQQQSFF